MGFGEVVEVGIGGLCGIWKLVLGLLVGALGESVYSGVVWVFWEGREGTLLKI